MKKNFSSILFWGSLWGLLEATLGYLLHLIDFILGLSSITMTSIGFYCIYRAFKNTDDINCAFLVSSIASSIKFVNFLLPLSSPFKVINPAIAILLEGAFAYLAIKSFSDNKLNIKEIISFNFLWRFTFVFIQIIEMQFSPMKPIIFRGSSKALGFLLYQPLVSSFVILFLVFLINNSEKRFKKLSFKPSISFSLFFMALFAQFML